MTRRPRLVPLAPAPGSEAALDVSPFWLGAGATCGLRLHLPGVAERHAAVVEREDGFWLVPTRAVDPAPRVNGEPAPSELRLRSGDVVELLPGVAFRFVHGKSPIARAARRPPAREPPPPRRSSPVRRRIASRVRGWSSLLGPAGWAAAALTVLLAAGAGALLVRAAPSGPAARPLSEAEAELIDALTLRAADHVERGTTLLEMGLADAALHEFARAVSTMSSSRLRDEPALRRSVAALESAIASIYRTRRIVVPRRYAEVKGPGGARPPMGASIPRAEFAERFGRVQRRFHERFGRPLVVTGRDHPEHLSLYGAGSALDLRVRDLSREQVRFAVATLRAEGIRVKDFSEDAALRAQVRRAHAAGVSGRAGTGLHLHADRFPDRRDPWTVP